MRRTRFALALLPVLATTAACEIPGRGNPRDPANIPDARVEIYENQVGGVPIVQASYTESVFLAAAKSEPSSHDLRVRWFVEVPDVPGRFEVNGGEEVRISESPRQTFRFNNALPPDLVVDNGALGVTVIAQVRDADTGGVGEGTRFFQVINRPPVIGAQRYVEITPGGRWWKDPGPERQIVTVLKALATDPDPGDPPAVTWEQIGGRAAAFETVGRDAVVDIPLWEQTLSFRARALDAAQAETIADVVVAVQDIVWIADGSGLVRRAQEPPLAVSLDPTTTDAWTIGAATTALGETVVWTAERALTGNWSVVRRTPEVAVSGASSFDTGIDAGANELRGGVFTNNAGVAWFAAGDTLLAFDDAAVLAAPAVVTTNRTLVTLSSDGITAPHALAPVTGSVAGDVWALFDEGTPTVRRVSSTTGVSATGTAVAGAIAVEPAFDGGAWVLVSDPDDAAFPPVIVRLDAAGALAGDPLALPFPTAARARTFGARSPVHDVECLRFVIAGGSSTANSFLALVEARDALTGLPSDGIGGNPVLAETVRFPEAPVSDVALDPQDGGAWTLVPSTGRVRKYLFDGTVLRSAGDLTYFPGAVPSLLRSDVRTGSAWVADHAGSLRGIPGTPLAPYADSSVLSSPDGLQLDPERNRLAASGRGDLAVVVSSGSNVERQFFLPDLGHPGGPVGATIDPDTGCLWFASEAGPAGTPPSHLSRQICRDGVTGVLANATSAGVPSIQAIDFDPVERGLCIAGANALGGLELTVLEPDGTTLATWDRVDIAGTEVVDVRSSPLDGSCWYLTDTSVGRVDVLSGVIEESAALPPGRSLAIGPDGAALYVDPVGDRIRRVTPSPLTFDDFKDFSIADTYRNARSVAIDPVRGVVWVAVGPKAGDDSPPALLQFNPAGDRIGIVPASDPVHVIVNR